MSFMFNGAFISTKGNSWEECEICGREALKEENNEGVCYICGLNMCGCCYGRCSECGDLVCDECVCDCKEAK